jgi:hypothetical protein
MTRALTILFVASAVLVASCSKPTTVADQSVFPGETYQIVGCSNPPNLNTDPYTIQIGSNFELRKDVVTILGTQGTNGIQHKHKSPLDIITLIKGGSATTITIELKDASLHFNKDMPIVGGDPSAPSHFCSVTLDSASDPRWLSFTVYPDALGQLSSDYNLALLVDQNGSKTDQMPIVLDPWVDNDGVNARK